ncbi:MAG: DUF3822 family protein [Ferruginibacter sp.]|nr:DUF3822 family protein [Chitinophagaceae bacterium]
MKQLFQIENNSPGKLHQVLSLRVGEKHCSFATSDKYGSQLHKLTYCTSDNKPATGWDKNELLAFFTDYSLLPRLFDQVLICYDFPQSLFVSGAGYNQDEAGLLLTTLGNGHGNRKMNSELIPGWNVYNMYTVPVEIQELFEEAFPAAAYQHQYALGLKSLTKRYDGATLAIDFDTDHFNVIAVSGSQFLLAQTFEYVTPGDVLYYLLKTSQQFSLAQDEVRLQLSGLVEKDSALFKELEQYFIHVECREARWEQNSGYPAHFFTSLNDLARCAS